MSNFRKTLAVRGYKLLTILYSYTHKNLPFKNCFLSHVYPILTWQVPCKSRPFLTILSAMSTVCACAQCMSVTQCQAKFLTSCHVCMHKAQNNILHMKYAENIDD